MRAPRGLIRGWLAPSDDLGYYTLAGAAPDPYELIREAHDGERLGLGWVFVSERLNVKEAATLSGAIGAVSTTLRIATAATNHHTRHPLVTAAYATTMHRLTRGRFTLGIGRGIAPLTAALGLAPVTTAQLEDFAGLMRRLWRGEAVIGHDGPCGKYPFLRLDPEFDEDDPAGDHRVRSEHAASRWAGVRSGRAAHVLRGCNARPLCADREG